MPTRPLAVMRLQARLVPLTSLWVVTPAVISPREIAISISETLVILAIPSLSESAQVASTQVLLSLAFLGSPRPGGGRSPSLQTESSEPMFGPGDSRTKSDRWIEPAKRSWHFNR